MLFVLALVGCWLLLKFNFHLTYFKTQHDYNSRRDDPNHYYKIIIIYKIMGAITKYSILTHNFYSSFSI